MEERLQKILSQAGICSRRKAEEYLLAGRIEVNGVRAALGDKAAPGTDHITLDGRAVMPQETKVYVMLNKPRGYVTTLSDEKGRKTVAELVGALGLRVWPVGRLDINSEGLLILCNDGELTHQLIHPSHEVEKEYHTWVTGDVEAAIPQLTSKMELDGACYLPAKVKRIQITGEGALLSITIHEGKHRQVRRMCAGAGLNVRRLKRVREGNLRLDPKLKPGQWRPLNEVEVLQLFL